MTKSIIARTVLASQVQAAFNTRITDKDGASYLVADMLRSMKKHAYTMGLFPEQDLGIVQSMIYANCSALVRLMLVKDKPVHGQPQEGSRDTNDTGREHVGALESEERGKERAAEIANVSQTLAYLERHQFSLMKRIRSLKEEAGHRTEDGERLRFNFKNDQYIPKPITFDLWLERAKGEAEVGSIWAMKLDLASEIVLPHVGEQDVLDTDLKFIDEERIRASSIRAHEAILELLTTIGEEHHRHSEVMASLNAELACVNEAYDNPQVRKGYVDVVKAEMARENREHRQAINRPVWLLGKRLEAVTLLSHIGAPRTLLDSPEWRAEEAKLRAAAARAKAAEVQAEMLEVQASMMEMESNMMLMQVRAEMAEMQKAMQKQMKEMRAMTTSLSGAPAKATKAKTKKPVKGELVEDNLEASFKAEKPANTSTKTLASGFVHTTRGRAGSPLGPRAK